MNITSGFLQHRIKTQNTNEDRKKNKWRNNNKNNKESHSTKTQSSDRTVCNKFVRVREHKFFPRL